MVSDRKKKIRALGVFAFFVIGVAMFFKFSPYHVCLRYYETEGRGSGMVEETAKQYATDLCKAKNPLRN